MPAVFDAKELLERVDNDRAFLAELLAMLKVEGRRVLDQIRNAVSAGDVVAVAKSAHALKGMVSNFCAPTAHASASALEQLAKNGDLAALPPALLALEADLEQLIADLTVFLDASMTCES